MHTTLTFLDIAIFAFVSIINIIGMALTTFFILPFIILGTFCAKLSNAIGIVWCIMLFIAIIVGVVLYCRNDINPYFRKIKNDKIFFYKHIIGFLLVMFALLFSPNIKVLHNISEIFSVKGSFCKANSLLGVDNIAQMKAIQHDFIHNKIQSLSDNKDSGYGCNDPRMLFMIMFLLVVFLTNKIDTLKKKKTQ